MRAILLALLVFILPTVSEADTVAIADYVSSPQSQYAVDKLRSALTERGYARGGAGSSPDYVVTLAIEPKALEKEDPYPLLVLRGGIEFNEWFAGWAERMESQLLAPSAHERSQ